MSESYLERDQNFFEQEPFSLLEPIAEAKNFELERLRALLYYIHQFELRVNVVGKFDVVTEQLIARSESTVERLIGRAAKEHVTGGIKVKGSKRLLPNYSRVRGVFIQAAILLKDYPQWYDYLSEYTGAWKPWNLD